MHVFRGGIPEGENVHESRRVVALLIGLVPDRPGLVRAHVLDELADGGGRAIETVGSDLENGRLVDHRHHSSTEPSPARHFGAACRLLMLAS